MHFYPRNTTHQTKKIVQKNRVFWPKIAQNRPKIDLKKGVKSSLLWSIIQAPPKSIKKDETQKHSSTFFENWGKQLSGKWGAKEHFIAPKSPKIEKGGCGNTTPGWPTRFSRFSTPDLPLRKSRKVAFRLFHRKCRNRPENPEKSIMTKKRVKNWIIWRSQTRPNFDPPKKRGQKRVQNRLNRTKKSR
jgi:hypothetical protein